MYDIIRQMKENFSPPFEARECYICDSRGYLIATLSNCLISREDCAKLAEMICEILNGADNDR